MEVVKNPIIIALFISGLTFAYLNFYQKDKKDKKNKEKQYQTITIPAIIFIVVWLVSYAYQEYGEGNVQQEIVNDSCKIIGKTLQMPKLNDIPDIFLKIGD